MVTCWVDISTGRFLDRAPMGAEVGERVELDRNPDHARERYTGDVGDPIRAATPKELTDSDVEKKDERAAAFSDVLSPDLKAVLIVALWQSLGHQPTGPELAQATTRLKAVYKTLT